MNEYAQAEQDRASGLMPTSVQERSDRDELWTAFRRHVGIGWTNKTLTTFVAGWDAGIARADAVRAHHLATARRHDQMRQEQGRE